jgi:hypothetical protein
MAFALLFFKCVGFLPRLFLFSRIGSSFTEKTSKFFFVLPYAFSSLLILLFLLLVLAFAMAENF